MNEMLKTKTSEKEETKPTIYVYATNSYGVSIKVGTTVIWYPAREIDCCNELCIKKSSESPRYYIFATFACLSDAVTTIANLYSYLNQ